MARTLATLSTPHKTQVLEALGRQLQEEKSKVLTANRQDLERAELEGLASAKLERLMLTEESLGVVAEGVMQVAALPDPVGQVISERTVPSGLRVKKVRCPLGVILMIYESRPNVTIDAFALCFKSGNVAVLKGGHEAYHSNRALVRYERISNSATTGTSRMHPFS